MSDTPRTDARWLSEWTTHEYNPNASPAHGMCDFAAELERENQRFRNGFDNLLKILEDSPGLPLQLLEQEDLEKWTDIIHGILMALGPYEATGKPESVWESLLSVTGTKPAVAKPGAL